MNLNGKYALREAFSKSSLDNDMIRMAPHCMGDSDRHNSNYLQQSESEVQLLISTPIRILDHSSSKKKKTHLRPRSATHILSNQKSAASKIISNSVIISSLKKDDHRPMVLDFTLHNQVN